MGKNLHTQIMHGTLADIRRRVGLHEQDDKTENDNPEVSQSRPVEAVNILSGDVTVDGDLGNIGTEQLRAGLKQQKRERHRQQFPIRTQITEHPQHEPSVIRFAENLIFLMAIADHGSTSACAAISTSRSKLCRR